MAKKIPACSGDVHRVGYVWYPLVQRRRPLDELLVEERELLEEFVFDERETELVEDPIDREGAATELPLLREGADTVGVLGRLTLTPLLILFDEELEEPADDRVTAGALPAEAGVDDRLDADEGLVNPLPWFERLP